MRGFPKFLATPQDVQNLLADPDYTNQCLATLIDMFNADQAESKTAGGDLPNNPDVKYELITAEGKVDSVGIEDYPGPSLSRLGFKLSEFQKMVDAPIGPIKPTLNADPIGKP